MKVGRPNRRFDCDVLLDLCKKCYSMRQMSKMFNCSPHSIKKGILAIPNQMREKGYTDVAIEREAMPFITIYLDVPKSNTVLTGESN